MHLNAHGDKKRQFTLLMIVSPLAFRHSFHFSLAFRKWAIFITFHKVFFLFFCSVLISLLVGENRDGWRRWMDHL